MKTRIFAALLLAALVGTVRAVADPAPTALYNKSILLAWTEHRVQKSDSGTIKKSATNSDFVIFVSSAGRLFSRFMRQNYRSGRSNTSTLGPAGVASFAGVGQGPRSTRFEGGQLISDNKMKSGARRILVEFDDQYRGCQLKVIYGKEGGAPLYHRAMDGRMYYILSTEVISPTCEIKDGNVFAGEQP
jgi:hypothetical protein